MKRDWDKLRRQSKVKSFDPIASYRPFGSSARKRFSRFPTRKPSPPSRSAKPDHEQLLRVEGPNFVAGAVWKRQRGQWSCTHAAPIIEWMTRVSHPSVILNWIKCNSLSFSWVPYHLATPAQSINPRTLHPAEATATHASADQSPNTVESTTAQRTPTERNTSPACNDVPWSGMDIQPSPLNCSGLKTGYPQERCQL